MPPPISPYRTVLPSSLIRQAAFSRLAKPGETIEAFIQARKRDFLRGYHRKWDGDAHSLFDKYLEGLKS